MSEGVKSGCIINGKYYKCRTCFDPGQSLYSLNDECNKTKTWRDLLKEVGQLETSEDELLPNTMCSKCMDKLITFYDFILQIDNVNKKYMELLGNASDPLAVERFKKKEIISHISKIDKPVEEDFISEIKMEKEDVDEYVPSNNEKDNTFDVNIPATAMELIWSPTAEGNQNLNSDDSNESSSSFEETDWLPRKKSRRVTNHLSEFYDKIKKVDNRFVCPKCKKKFSTSATCRRHLDKMHTQQSSEDSSSSSSDECDDAPLTSTSQTKEDFSIYEKIEKINDRFVCPICKKSFTLHRNCRRHIQYLHLKEQNTFYCGFCELTFTIKDYLNAHLKRMHPGETLESNSKKIERLFGERLYSKPTAWHRVECKLCSITFTTTKELRQHLENHCNLDSLYNLELSNEISQHLFININDLSSIKETIVKDISDKNYFKYYTVLNEYGYEMSVSDTEAEDLLEDAIERAGRYKCELCSETFSFKYQVFDHLKEGHPKEEIPLKCKRCKLEFVSIDMHEKHLQTHCENLDKVVYCNNCPGRFVWQQNMKNHNCPLHNSKDQQKSSETLVTGKSKNEEHIDLQTCNTDKNEIAEFFKTPLNNSDSQKSTKIYKTIIRCALCEESFKKLRHLHQHMPLHNDGITGIDFQNSTYIKVFKHLELIDYPVWQQQIKEAYTKSQISQFYMVIDKYGNELDISDSDSTDDTDTTEYIKKEYACDICKEIFHKRKFLLKHQQEQHNNETLPFTCKNCNQQFVNFNLLQQHLKKVCWNEHRQNAEECEFCNESFIWPDNLVKHREIQHSKSTKYPIGTPTTSVTVPAVPAERFFPNDESSILAEFSPAEPSPSFLFYCLMCPKTFYTIENLNEHLQGHRLTATDIKTVESIVHSTWWPNGQKKIMCKICNVTFKTMNNLKEHFSPTNLKNPCANQHSLANYSIINQKGFELHLELDSETEVEDENNATETKNTFPYKCCMCNKSFKRKYQVAQHQRSMHNYEFLELKCERCLFRTVSQKVLDYHKATQCFNMDKKFKCDQCNFKFMWPENLDNHIKTLHTPKDLNVTSNSSNEQISTTNNKNFVIISQQLKNTGYEESVDVTKVSKKSEKPTTSRSNKHVCHICGSNFTNNNNLKVHIMRHNKTNLPFKCDFCEMTFPRNADLQEHRRTHTGERPYKCTLCEKSFSRKNKLTMHTRLHTGELPYHCTLCPKSFNRAEHLKLHLLGHKGDKPYKCNICGKGFICDSYLNRHRKDVGHDELWSTPDNNITNTNDGEKNSSNSKKQSLCPICGISLSRNTSVTTHMRTHTGEKPHKCDFCEMSFVRRCDLTDHRRVHTAERPFQCTYCEKAFPRRCQLTVHIRTHTGERPYKCTYCGKAFIRSESLKLHVRIHTGEKPFSCEVCNLAFSCARYLKKHRIAKGHHEEKELNMVPE